MIRAITALLAWAALAGCAPDFHMRGPPAAPGLLHGARLKLDDEARTPAYPLAGPFAGWLPLQREAARQLHEAIVKDLGGRPGNAGGAGTLVVHLRYIDVSIHKTVVDHPPFIIPADDPGPHPVRTTVLGTLALVDDRGEIRRTAPLDIHVLVMHKLDGEGAVRDAVGQASRLTLADLYRAVGRLAASSAP